MIRRILLSHLDLEGVLTAGTPHTVFACLPRQSKGGMALGTGAENVFGRVRGELGASLRGEFCLDAEPSLVFPATLGNITGKEAVNGKYQ